MAFTIEPTNRHDDRVTEWLIKQDGLPYLECSAGGSGDCWNVREAAYEGDDVGDYLHVCELQELIDALTFLRDSEAHKLNVARWAS